MIIPKLLAVEIAAACNARCPYCARTYLGHSNEIMSLELYKKILVEGRAAGIKDLRLYLWGEPTLHPKMTLFAALAQELGYDVTLSSNGHLFDRHLDCLRYVSDVRFSVEGWDETSYAQHRVGLDFMRVMRSLRAAYAFREKHGLNVKLSIGTVSGRNINIGAFLDCWYGDGKIVDSIHFSGMFPYTLFNAEAGKFELHGLNDWLDKYFVFARQERIESFCCNYLYDTMCIGVDGTVPLCCNDVKAVIAKSSVKDMNLIEAYNVPPIQALRQAHRCGDYKMCKDGCMFLMQPTVEWVDFKRRVWDTAKEKGLEGIVS